VSADPDVEEAEAAEVQEEHVDIIVCGVVMTDSSRISLEWIVGSRSILLAVGSSSILGL